MSDEGYADKYFYLVTLSGHTRIRDRSVGVRLPWCHHNKYFMEAYMLSLDYMIGSSHPLQRAFDTLVLTYELSTETAYQILMLHLYSYLVEKIDTSYKIVGPPCVSDKCLDGKYSVIDGTKLLNVIETDGYVYQRHAIVQSLLAKRQKMGACADQK